MITLRNISKSFGEVKAVDHVDLTIEAGCLHAMIGENGAGKSTLMKILSGRYQTDEGQVFLDGKQVRFANPSDALRSGIGMLYQEPTDFPSMNVLDCTNVGFSRKGRITSRQISGDIERLVSQHGFQLSPDMCVENLSLGQRQQLELLWLLLQELPVLIFDEPTTGNITLEQQQTLFRSLRNLAEEGKTVIFVSHNLREVTKLADVVTVMRSGNVVATYQFPVDEKTLIRAMFGQEMNLCFIREPIVLGEILLTAESPEYVLKVRQGESIGLAGLEGSGQGQLLRELVGLKRNKWTVHLGNEEIHSFSQAEKLGIFFQPASRLEEGLVAGLSIAEHILLTTDELRNARLVSQTRVATVAERKVQQFSIQTPSTNLLVEQLSGGNQQRLLLAIMPEHARLLILESPTRGLDYASTSQFWKELCLKRQLGTSIVFSSPDVDELWQQADRVLVFIGGSVIGEVNTRKDEQWKLRQLIGGLT